MRIRTTSFPLRNLKQKKKKPSGRSWQEAFPRLLSLLGEGGPSEPPRRVLGVTHSGRPGGKGGLRKNKDPEGTSRLGGDFQRSAGAKTSAEVWG